MLERVEIPKIDLLDSLEGTILWNEIACLGAHDLSEKRIELQHSLVVEEARELEEAYKAGDKVEVVDAICDLIFVALYADFLEDHKAFKLGLYDLNMDGASVGILFSHSDEELLEILYGFVADKLYSNIVQMCIDFGFIYKFDLAGAYNEVLESNMSKFPLVEETDINHELLYFSTKSKYNSVTHTVYNGRYLFRCDGGEGKIVKPTAFKEPKLEVYIG